MSSNAAAKHLDIVRFSASLIGSGDFADPNTKIKLTARLWVMHHRKVKTPFQLLEFKVVKHGTLKLRNVQVDLEHHRFTYRNEPVKFTNDKKVIDIIKENLNV
jgi:hypothetical protein